MKKFFLPFSLLLLILILAATPFVPTSYGSFSALKIAKDGSVPVLPEISYEYANPLLPSYLEDNAQGFGDHYNPPGNPITNAGARLGRVLFYDTRLSKNQTISCASCHVASLGFSDSATFSKGFDGSLTTRQSMGLTNARVQPSGRFFWDASATVLKEQVTMAITSSVEMGMEMHEVNSRLKNAGFYQGLFADAFGDPNISSDRITSAIGQFVRSMVSKNSKFDLAVVQEDRFFPPFETFSQIENDGYKLFLDVGCANCHVVPHFVGELPTNNGLDANNANDKGLGEKTHSSFDEGKFKAPQLRNIELTAPYMHDGRFKTLEEVIEHYNSGIQPNPALGEQLKNSFDGTPVRLKLSSYQKQSLVAFLKTLTDPYFVNDPRFEDPFAITEPGKVESTPMDRILNRKHFGNSSQAGRVVSVFPNPFVDKLNVQLKNPDGLKVEIKMFDMSGRLIFSQKESGENFKIARGNLRPGSYVLKVESLIHSWTQPVQVH